MDRDFDIVLFGASGFTGGLTAEYLAAHAPTGCRWALAGRNPAKLTALRERLAAINPACAELRLLHAAADDPKSLADVARRTRVLVTTVGPYIQHGEHLVAACAQNGTDYLDLTGEPEFVDRMYTRYHATAQATGARIIHACGFDSIPYDLGVYFTVAQLPDDQPIHIDGFIRAHGLASGGTLNSALLHLSRQPQVHAAARKRLASEPALIGRNARTRLGVPHRNKTAQAWVAPLPTIDPQIVARSARLLDNYGPNFTYTHYAAMRRLPIFFGAAAGIALTAGIAQLPPARRAITRLLPAGTGPTEQRRANGWFTARFHGTAAGNEVITEVSGGDPAYGETSKMLAESALCLAYDELPPTAGQTTTAAAMGNALIHRLQAAGLTFTVLSDRPTTPPSRIPASA